MSKRIDSCMYAAIGFENYAVWISKNSATCSQCKKMFRGTHMHPITTTKAIKAFKRSIGEYNKK
jgi:hypothetical protein